MVNMYSLSKVIAAVSALLGVLGQCRNPVQRREMGSLSPSERGHFIDALQKLHQKSSVDDDSKYDGYARLHEANSQQAHGQPQFLPWHRQYIRNLEKDLQAIDPSVVLPYWDWSKDYENPHDSYIFRSAFMGGNGAGRKSCVGDGPFKSWNMATPSPHCLSRDFDGGDSISPFVSPRVISQLLQIQDFSEFSERLEVAHGAIHVNIGGSVGDLAPMWSPNESEPYNGERNGRSVRTNDVMRPFGVTVASVLRTNTQEHCYTYPSFQADRTGGSSRTSEINPTRNNELSLFELLGLRTTHGPKPLPKSFIAMSSMNEGKVRKIEQELLELDS